MILLGKKAESEGNKTLPFAKDCRTASGPLAYWIASSLLAQAKSIINTISAAWKGLSAS